MLKEYSKRKRFLFSCKFGCTNRNKIKTLTNHFDLVVFDFQTSFNKRKATKEKQALAIFWFMNSQLISGGGKTVFNSLKKLVSNHTSPVGNVHVRGVVIFFAKF